VLNNLMQYAIEIGAVPANPLKAVKWTRPRTLKTVDPRAVVNGDQARRLLATVGQQNQRGERMVAFFGCIYYAALRPEEVVDLRLDNLVSLPDQGWGELILTNSEPRSGTWWTDSGSARQRRELKHRPRGETRLVPLHPELVALLTQHLKKYPPGLAGRIFTGPRGGIFNDRAYLKIFHKARAVAFTKSESASLLARRPYDLRHAALSTWLNAGVPASQVAEWAGHSVDVLLRGLRQVHLRPAGRSQAPHRGSHPTPRGPVDDGPAAAQTWARIGHSSPHMSARSRLQPHMTLLGPEPDLPSSGPI
jgi:integrase